MACDNALDFACQLRQHSLRSFAQHQGGVLSSEAAQQTLRQAAATLVPPGWVGDDWVREVTLAPQHWPRALQRALCMPRCIGTASLHVYLMVNGTLLLLFTLLVRLVLAATLGPPPPAGRSATWREWLAARQQLLVVVPAVYVCVSIGQAALFWGFGRWLPWLQTPPMLLTTSLVVYSFLLQHATNATANWGAAVLRTRR